MSLREPSGGIVDVDLERREPANVPVEAGDPQGGSLLRFWHGGLPVASTWAGSLQRHDLSQRVATSVTERAIARALLDDADHLGGFQQFVERAVTTQTSPSAPPTVLPSLTIAVCTRERAQDLERCLLSLDGLVFPGTLETLVVDNAPSSGQTADVCSRFASRVRYVREERPGLDWARNRAVTEASGSLIAFTDDDCVADRNWAAWLAAPFAVDDRVEAVTGLVTPLELVTEAQRLFEYLGGFGKGYTRQWFRHTPARGARIAARYGRTSQFGTGANMAFRTATLRRNGGFDPALDAGTITLGAGDLEMFFRILKSGGSLVYEPRAVIHHRHRRTMDELVEQMRSWGTGMTSYITRSVQSWEDERPGFAVLFAWLSQHWLSNVALAAAGVLPVPTRLVVAEARAGLTSFTRYGRARKIAASIAESFGGTLHDHRIAGAPVRTPPSDTVEERVRLDQPIRAIEVSERTANLRLVGTWGGVTICTAVIDAQGQAIPALQIADALAAAAVKRPEIADLAGSLFE